MLDHSTVYLAGGEDIIIIVAAALVFLGKLFFQTISSSDDSDKEIDDAEKKHQEELRRKIREKMEAARRENQGKLTPQTVLHDVMEDRVSERPRMQEPVVVKAEEPVHEEMFSEPVVEEDPLLAIKRRIETLKQQGLDAQHKVEAIQSTKSVPAPQRGFQPRERVGSLRASLKQSLSNPQSAQQAILLAEVLGKPKGLQQ